MSARSALLAAVLAAAPAAAAPPVTGHPRLWLGAGDLPRLRSWATSANAVWRDGLQPLAARAVQDMDTGLVPGQDTGGFTYVDYPTEMYAELFAFMSLLAPDQPTRDAYAGRARTLLMYVINAALPGPAAGQPFRDPEFSVNDRSRWHGEAFGLTVDWIYPYLTPADKAAIRTVFLRWASENLVAAVTGWDHPEPVGVINDPVLVADGRRVRWAANNYFTAHMRNIGLVAMALEATDDAGDALRNHVRNATGAWLYVIDHVMRNDARGGLFPEGFEYAPQTVGYVAQLFLALKTAGHDDPAVHGPQVILDDNPFWELFVRGALHSLSPRAVLSPNLGEPVYQPAWYGDGLNYWSPDFIGVFGPLGLHDAITGKLSRLAVLRWFETEHPPGGPAALGTRALDLGFFQNGILYFMLIDPAAAPPPDPRPGLSRAFFAPGLGRVLARTSWGPEARWFSYKLSWNIADHQMGDGNQVELYRGGERLTKERTGYDLDYGGSNNHNTLCLLNDAPINNDPGEYRNINWLLGSQWAYVSAGDPNLGALSWGPDYVHGSGDATNLHNSTYEASADILHASRSFFWLQPDHLVLYARAASATAGRFKRFWLNLPAAATVTGNVATMTTPSGQRLHVTSLLPAGAALTSEPATITAGNAATEDPILFRVRVEAPGPPLTTRFLHVLQGADPGTPADPATLVQSVGGTAYAGALVRSTAVVFPVEPGAAFAGTTYRVPAGTVSHRVTGLAPYARYTVAASAVGGEVEVTVTSAGPERADVGGVLTWPNPEPDVLLRDGFELGPQSLGR
jgi:hypothetical protein